MKKIWLIPLIAALVLIADTASKQWALANLQEGVLRPFVPGILQLTLTTNTGGAFGIFRQFKVLMTILPIAVCAAIIFWIAKRTKSANPLSAWEQCAYGLVLGGALGNIVERLYRGHVTDFLDFAFIDFPVFNVADALIDVGVAIILICTLFTKSNETPEESAAVPRHD